ncbi:MAG: ATP-binding cassette domain-containing protein, partial [Candidatus Alcyoniella australis]|nr:ATP-binding cassette domain-containing protein [Candidatus Alcyoniella australis]
MARPAISFENVSLNYRLFHERSASLKATLISKVKRSDTCEIFPALKNVGFQVEHGQTVAVMGRNGSGKSTLLKLVASIFDPSAGRVRIDGRVAALLELGAGFHPDLTG